MPKMTNAQRLLYWLGAARFQAFRRWVGGRWERRFAPHVPGIPCGKWRAVKPHVFTGVNDAIRRYMVADRTAQLGGYDGIIPNPYIQRMAEEEIADRFGMDVEVYPPGDPLPRARMVRR